MNMDRESYELTPCSHCETDPEMERAMAGFTDQINWCQVYCPSCEQRASKEPLEELAASSWNYQQLPRMDNKAVIPEKYSHLTAFKTHLAHRPSGRYTIRLVADQPDTDGSEPAFELAYGGKGQDVMEVALKAAYRLALTIDHLCEVAISKSLKDGENPNLNPKLRVAGWRSRWRKARKELSNKLEGGVT